MSTPSTPPVPATTPVVFIGSGEASTLERKTLIYSIRKTASGPVDIAVFNGTHNTVEREGQAPQPVPMSLPAKYRNITEFSNYRYFIPRLCGYKGRAIWLDSDIICMTDIHELFNTPMNGADILAKTKKGPQGDTRWSLSVSLMDCSSCRFDLDQYTREVDEGLYVYNDLHQLTRRFLDVHPFKPGQLDPNWNAYDEYVPGRTKMVHYTNLHTQPWKVRGHRHGAVWFRWFREAQAAGYVTEQDIELAIRRFHVRPDIHKGNTIGVGDIVRNAIVDLKASVRDSVRRPSA